MNSPSPDRYLVTGSLSHSLQAHSPRRRSANTKKNKQIRKRKNERYTRTLATVRFLNWPETAENCVSWVVCEEKQRLASSRGTGTSAFPKCVITRARLHVNFLPAFFFLKKIASPNTTNKKKRKRANGERTKRRRIYILCV